MENKNSNDEKITNLDYLVEVSKGDKVFVKEMISLYLSENPEEIHSLEKGILEKNYDLIRSVAHKLRSTIPFIGLDKVIEKDVVKVESLAAERTSIGEIEKLFSKIKAMCQKSWLELRPV